MTPTIFDRAVASARAFVGEVHPEAAAAALAGSIPAGRGTDTSDLDVVLYYADRTVNYAETLRYDGWLVESFVYGPEGIEEWFAKEAGLRRPVALDMWATGLPLMGEDVADQLRDKAGAILDAGPAPLDPYQRDDLRYGLTAAIDDLRGNPAPEEALAVMADVFVRSAELLLFANNGWLGTGKWLVRRLGSLDRPEATDLIGWAESAERSGDELCRVASAVLDSVGGALQEGHVRGRRDTHAKGGS
ncbi:hypothetical protein ACRQ5B_13200 [Pseudarthrobacter sp. L19]|uniref:hypothetical protein n=1 Tax=Pseudarthrobacter sp. L19 TaxID=3423951 RepID=UPI003D7AFCB6